MSEALGELRLDLALYHLRFCKTRALAQNLIKKKRVRVNGDKVSKSSRKIRIGDVLVFPQGREVRSVRILGLVSQRVGAPQACELYEKINGADLSHSLNLPA